MFRIGEHVEEWEELGFSKIVGIKNENGRILYHCREMAHPHRMRWSDEYHISRPLHKRHDKVLDKDLKNHYY